MLSIILSSVACLSLPCIFTLSHKGQDFRKKKDIEHKMCAFIFSTILSENFPILEGIQGGIMINVHRSPRRVPVILVRFLIEIEFSRRFSKNSQISNFMKIRPVGTELFHVYGRT